MQKLKPRTISPDHVNLAIEELASMDVETMSELVGNADPVTVARCYDLARAFIMREVRELARAGHRQRASRIEKALAAMDSATKMLIASEPRRRSSAAAAAPAPAPGSTP